MIRLGTSLSILLLILCVSAIRGDEEDSKPPPPPTHDRTGLLYGGMVTDVTKTAITIQWAKEPPKEFALSVDLLVGRVPKKPNPLPGKAQGYTVPPMFMYPLADVKVGDVVAIYYTHLGKLDICDHISIQKRPGGRVPPLPQEAEDLLNTAAIMKAKLPPGTPLPPSLRDAVHIPYHEKQNAHWDLVDKGIPYPEKFGAKRLWPVAPYPHEVKPGR